MKKWLFVILIITATASLFMNCHPQFGAQKKERVSYTDSPNYNPKKKGFQNLRPAPLTMGEQPFGEAVKELFADNTKPQQAQPTRWDVGRDIESDATLQWYGHSAVLLELNGQRIFIDPMLTHAASPMPLFVRRFEYETPIDFAQVGALDAIIISHDHYDHLDYKSILALQEQTKQFIVPLGIGSHLRSWGVPAAKITELDWYEMTQFQGVEYRCMPSQHSSGRGVSDMRSTLWGGWQLKSDSYNVYYTGDGGYGPHFKKAAAEYGPFDLAIIETGQYNIKWQNIHLLPEHSVQAALDLEAKRIFSVHWGAFKLANHAWNEPPQTMVNGANTHGYELMIPFLGERVDLRAPARVETWWQEAAL